MSILKVLRLQKGLTIRTASQKIGISSTKYHAIETGTQTADIETINKLADLFEVPAHKLFESVKFKVKAMEKVI
ncbi:helix-turn-helix transcriptional regulator [Bacillus sp. FSL K6-6483]